MEEVAYFDIYPDNDDAQFNGTWSNYPYFPSGVVAVSSIEGGIFFVQPNIVNESGCPADFNADQVISVADLLLLISDFGCINSCETDLNGDEAVNVDDLLQFLIAFGSPC